MYKVNASGSVYIVYCACMFHHSRIYMTILVAVQEMEVEYYVAMAIIAKY